MSSYTVIRAPNVRVCVTAQTIMQVALFKEEANETVNKFMFGLKLLKCVYSNGPGIFKVTQH